MVHSYRNSLFVEISNLAFSRKADCLTLESALKAMIWRFFSDLDMRKTNTPLITSMAMMVENADSRLFKSLPFADCSHLQSDDNGRSI
jgi:hypothetical protein